VFNIQKAVSRLNFAPKLNEIEITDIKNGIGVFTPKVEAWGDRQAGLRFGLELPTGKKSAPGDQQLQAPEFVRQQLSPISGGLSPHADLTYSQAKGRFIFGANAEGVLRSKRDGFRMGRELRINMINVRNFGDDSSRFAPAFPGLGSPKWWRLAARQPLLARSQSELCCAFVPTGSGEQSAPRSMRTINKASNADF